MPLYCCQPPTGYKDTADAWVNTGALVGRMNFALDAREQQACAGVVGNGDALADDGLDRRSSDAIRRNPTRPTVDTRPPSQREDATDAGSPEFQTALTRMQCRLQTAGGDSHDFTTESS